MTDLPEDNATLGGLRSARNVLAKRLSKADQRIHSAKFTILELRAALAEAVEARDTAQGERMHMKDDLARVMEERDIALDDEEENETRLARVTAERDRLYWLVMHGGPGRKLSDDAHYTWQRAYFALKDLEEASDE